jgi:hypothetical protein
MAYREVAVTEVREALRAWLAGKGLRGVAEQAGMDRKTARRYVDAAVQARASTLTGRARSVSAGSRRCIAASVPRMLASVLASA